MKVYNKVANEFEISEFTREEDITDKREYDGRRDESMKVRIMMTNCSLTNSRIKEINKMH